MTGRISHKIFLTNCHFEKEVKEWTNLEYRWGRGAEVFFAGGELMSFVLLRKVGNYTAYGIPNEIIPMGI